jgi:hypothetical protein
MVPRRDHHSVGHLPDDLQLDPREVGSRVEELLSIIRTDQANLSAVLAASSIRAIGTPAKTQLLHPLVMYLLWGLSRHSAFMLRFTSVLFGVRDLV